MKKLAWLDNPTLIRTNQLDFYASGDLFSSKICMLEGFQSKKKRVGSTTSLTSVLGTGSPLPQRGLWLHLPHPQLHGQPLLKS